MKLLAQKIKKEAILPSYAHTGDAGLDLFSVEAQWIKAGESALVATGIKIALPPGTEGQVRPRSGLALRHMITLLNSPGTIDEGYRGEIKVIVMNHGKEDFLVEKGMKIAQMVVAPCCCVEVEEADIELNTSRGSGGFGSTGV